LTRSGRQIEAGIRRKSWLSRLCKAVFKYTLYAAYKGFWLIAIEGYVLALKIKYELMRQWGPPAVPREQRRRYVKQVGRKMTSGKYYGQVDGNTDRELDRLKRERIQAVLAKIKK
jgi:hypothetical protein